LLGFYCVFFSADDRMAFPGETIVGWISFLEPDQQQEKIHEGLTFEFRAGRPVICEGTVIEVINPRLWAENREQDRV